MNPTVKSPNFLINLFRFFVTDSDHLLLISASVTVFQMEHSPAAWVIPDVTIVGRFTRHLLITTQHCLWLGLCRGTLIQSLL
jgi:hypothetical protein